MLLYHHDRFGQQWKCEGRDKVHQIFQAEPYFYKRRLRTSCNGTGDEKSKEELYLMSKSLKRLLFPPTVAMDYRHQRKFWGLPRFLCGAISVKTEVNAVLIGHRQSTLLLSFPEPLLQDGLKVVSVPRIRFPKGATKRRHWN